LGRRLVPEGTRWNAKIATATEIHCRNKLKPRRIGDVMVGAGNDNLSGFKWLAKQVKNNAENSASSSRNKTP
jgi:hypothetical protein